MRANLETVRAEEEEKEVSDFSLSNTPLSVSHSELVSEQRADSTLKELFQSVLSEGERLGLDLELRLGLDLELRLGLGLDLDLGLRLDLGLDL
ncbi:unnamed protein product [Merluccius merluccius]